MIDVTIIVPIYNAEKDLSRCLNSLINQNYDKSKMEILLVDDCSTDNSLAIAKEYLVANPFITLKQLEKNQGVSHARNIGIKEAKGKYLIFCDSDDYYELNTVSIFMNNIIKYSADFITANYFITSEQKNIKVDTTSSFKDNYISKQETISYITLTSCSKIIKRDIFINNNIYYPEGIKQCEELTVIPIVAYLSERPVAINETLYHYCQRKNSVSNTIPSNIDFFEDTFKMFSDRIDKSKYFEELEFRAIEHLVYGKTLVMLKKGKETKDIKLYIQNLKKQYPKFYKNKYIKKLNVLKKVFIFATYSENLLIPKIYTWLHRKITDRC